MQCDASEDPMVGTPNVVNILPTSEGPAPDIIADLDLSGDNDSVEF